MRTFFGKAVHLHAGPQIFQLVSNTSQNQNFEFDNTHRNFESNEIRQSVFNKIFALIVLKFHSKNFENYVWQTTR